MISFRNRPQVIVESLCIIGLVLVQLSTFIEQCKTFVVSPYVWFHYLTSCFAFLRISLGWVVNTRVKMIYFKELKTVAAMDPPIQSDNKANLYMRSS